MHRFAWFVLGLLLILGPAAPGDARVATIATTAPLENHEDETVAAAFRAALNAAVTGAAAMGLPWFQISRAIVLDDVVAVQILATDEDIEADTGQGAPDPENGLGADGLAPGESKPPGAGAPPKAEIQARTTSGGTPCTALVCAYA